ncbi:MAG: uridine phosphorylase [Anaerolineales bacterium]
MDNPGQRYPGGGKLDGAAQPFTAADLPVDEQGHIYHLQVKPEQIAPDVILVGDPGRAEMLGSTLLRDLEFKQEHRGLVTVTGTAQVTGRQATIISPLRTTVMTTGMGTPSLEIVLNELVALNEIDFEQRTRKEHFPRLHVIRLGSSGGLQSSTELGTPIITSYAIGLDNTGLYYESPYPDQTCKRLEEELDQLVSNAMNPASRYSGKIKPYVSRAEPRLVSALQEASDALGVASKTGLTLSSPGFFLPEGRDISRLKPNIPDLDKLFAEFDPGLNGQQVENNEMESSFLLHFLGGLGHWAAAICPAIANRRLDTFSSDYQQSMMDAANVALLALTIARSRFPGERMR